MSRELDLPPASTIDEPEARAEANRGGRKILRRATYLDGTTPTGMRVATTDVDMILYPVNATKIHITAPEIAHALMHEGRKTGVSAAEYSHAVLDPLDAIGSRKFTPKLAPILIQNGLGRTTYTDEQDVEAELAATMVMVTRSPRLRAVAQRNTSRLPASLQALFELPPAAVHAVAGVTR